MWDTFLNHPVKTNPCVGPEKPDFFVVVFLGGGLSQKEWARSEEF